MTHRGASYPPPAPSSSSSSSILALEASGANPELLRSMMDCVDTSLFSPAQLANWSHMKTQLAANAPDAPGPLTSNENELVVIKTEMPLDRSQGLHYNTGSGLRSTTTSSSSSNSTTAATAMEEENPVDFRPLLHREASIQDVLARVSWTSNRHRGDG